MYKFLKKIRLDFILPTINKIKELCGMQKEGQKNYK